MHNFLYSLTVYLLHYYPRHVSSINMPIFRRKNCIHTASGIFALCKCLHSKLVDSGLRGVRSQPVEDNSVTNILLMNKENCALKLVDEIILYYDARSKKHQIVHVYHYHLWFVVYSANIKVCKFKVCNKSADCKNFLITFLYTYVRFSR